VKREQVRELLKIMGANSYVTWETKVKWGMAFVEALSETDGDAAFERLKRRFSKNYAIFHHSSLGGCTERLVTA